ncbi:hypothetical protein Golax_004559 [Gossypium laxum]|uniref:Uncharacterized protein n=1 Tax=Gossypium laxum TaxID=34288 RepID=A0A7J9B2Q5_9ROSI|nr:hypothetical protein [Gossypium laxum]
MPSLLRLGRRMPSCLPRVPYNNRSLEIVKLIIGYEQHKSKYMGKLTHT